MLGVELVEVLKTQLECCSDSELAKKVGLTPGRISQIRAKRQRLEARYVGDFLGRAFAAGKESAFRSAIRPVVEFFPVEVANIRQNGRNMPFDPNGDGGRALATRLRSPHGLYAFYNSQAEIIYFGKAVKQSLYAEMINVFNRNIPHLQVYSVKHPWGRFASRNNGELRRIKSRPVKLSTVAAYFSAYDIEPYLISALEALFIRLVPNDIINVRIEKKDMKAFVEPEI
ncbi:hypothetical protein [Methylocystis sp.]|uniref:hypothetical protein n=1 Tax=Methylocystis sp. TaxID=1911079 RepID=UPI003DA32385